MRMPLCLAVGLALCSQPATAAPPASVGPAPQTSTAGIRADPAAGYALVKRLIAGLPEVAERLAAAEAAGTGSEVWDFGCPIVTVAAGPDADHAGLLVDLALMSVVARAEIVKLGYAKVEVDRILDGLEAKRLAALKPVLRDATDADIAYSKVQRETEKAAVAAFAKLRAGMKRKPMRIVVPEECFDEGFSKSVVTEPPGGKVRLLADFAERLCRAQGLDPADPARCDRWTAADAEAAVGHWGRYRYAIAWADGRSATGTVDIAVDQAETVTIPPPSPPR
ncbi:hypothetical protein [Prosthecodimorpha staleyi]|uniref:Uncharacterized protein n=1 Tax=Prosthecodimorpha staleyi TaxID=2840188 RepID=A0A947D332_9HYPH|nr:hypothetical protein [Prosthecodimorpha staleyi]MBT9290083.1 hypothetical protein [Prosthecodimorpha staleyi]